jgi:hypothetical protein
MLTLLLFLLCFIGWEMNIFKLVGDDVSIGIRVLRIIGIFVFPLGALMGYLF